MEVRAQARQKIRSLAVALRYFEGRKREEGREQFKKGRKLQARRRRKEITFNHARVPASHESVAVGGAVALLVQELIERGGELQRQKKGVKIILGLATSTFESWGCVARRRVTVHPTGTTPRASNRKTEVGSEEKPKTLSTLGGPRPVVDP